MTEKFSKWYEEFVTAYGDCSLNPEQLDALRNQLWATYPECHAEASAMATVAASPATPSPSISPILPVAAHDDDEVMIPDSQPVGRGRSRLVHTPPTPPSFSAARPPTAPTTRPPTMPTTAAAVVVPTPVRVQPSGLSSDTPFQMQQWTLALNYLRGLMYSQLISHAAGVHSFNHYRRHLRQQCSPSPFIDLTTTTQQYEQQRSVALSVDKLVKLFTKLITTNKFPKVTRNN